MNDARHPEQMTSALGPRRHSTASRSLVEIDNGELWTTSLVVAEKFGKRHDAVCRAIRNLECSTEFNRHNFVEISYVDVRGRAQPAYRISRDGFSFLAMGFTGKEAASWKERFIGAFKKLEGELRRIATGRCAPDWQEARQLGKADRRDLTDAVQALCERAHVRDESRTPLALWETAATRSVTSALFENEFHERIAGIRERLTTRQLRRLALAEAVYANALIAHLNSELHHRIINDEAKRAVVAFAGLTGGKEIPGVDRSARRLIGRPQQRTAELAVVR